MDEPEIPPSLEDRWSRLEIQDPPIDGTIRPADFALGTAPTLAAPGDASGPAPLAPPPKLHVRLDDDPPATEGELQIVGTLGEGGMSSVLLARQRSLRREVAVKAARPEDPRSAEAILAEGVITGALEHPGIVPVHLLGVDDEGRPAIVMKRVVGVTWATLIADPAHEGWLGWPGDPEDRLPGHVQILTAICNALAFAHSRGWVHRDIKPANVLIGRFGDVYLADWGIAARAGTASEGICGTPGYLAPEMATGEPVDARTDVYLLSACLHHVLMGAPRHVAPTALGAAALSIVSLPFPYPDHVPVELAALANRGCQRDPAARPGSAIAMRDALADWVAHRESVALAEAAAERVEELERLPATTTDVEARAAADRLEGRASFAVERALEIWPANPVATGLRERLEARLAERRAREAALAADARERDPWIDGTPRVAAFVAGVALLVGLSGASLGLGWPADPRVALVFYPAAFFVGCTTLAVIARRWLLRTRFNRDATFAILALFALMAVQRAAGVAADVPFERLYAVDAYLFAAGLGIYGITQRRWTIPVALVALAAGVTTTLWPEHALYTFSGLGLAAALLAGLLVALDWRRRSP